MIPSVGYFTAISKCEASYIRFVDDNTRKLKDQFEVIDEDTMLEYLLGEQLSMIGWKIGFITETEVYFQNRVTRQLDQCEGDLFSKIQELEFYFISVIQKEIIDNRMLLMNINEFITYLDAYTSLYMSTLEFNLVKPQLVPRSQLIHIIEGRNLLVEFQKTSFNSQNYELKQPCTTVVTGSNGSGKSIYLKTIGCLAYLA